jgi:Peptidase family M1 domain/Peptidase M1 N-terminal domain/HYDIN/CFA65/VesB-like, Ig-like domain
MSSFALSILVAAAASSPVTQAAPPEGIFDPPPIVRHQLEEGASKQAAYEEHQRTHGADAKNWATELPPPLYDVIGYDIDVFVDPARQILSGSVGVTLEAVADGLTEVSLDADLGLRVLSVIQVGNHEYQYDSPKEVAFEHVGDRLTVTLDPPLPAGELVRLQVTYGGHAWRGGLIGATGVNWYSNAGTPVIHTFAQPYGARVWWPCNDRPDDKARVSLRVTVPEDLDVAANGLETSRIDNGDGTATSYWHSRYPVPTYLVVMHVSDFVYSESTYTGLDGTTMPVGLWAMPQVADEAEADLAVTVPQIEVMAGHWGEYPFIDEKYGNATVFFGGGMEHQTMTTLAVSRVGDPWMQWLNVHELGHQWWGDWVTMDDWRHIWLNEGYATHTEWLWAEHLGPDVLEQYLEDEDWRGWFSGSVFDNPSPFSWTIYAKGSWVVWMLRHVIGDDAFFEAMTAYREVNGGTTGTTDELQEALENVSGMELDWFFDEWVYGLYRPRYIYDWSTGAGSMLELTVRQVQTNTGLFKMPMNIRVTTAGGIEDHRVWLEALAEQTVTIQLQADATAVELNPDTHVLAEIAHASEPDLELGPNFPDGYDFGIVPGSATATKDLPLTNTGGGELVIEGIWPQNGSLFELEDPPDFPLSILPGETVSVTILFDPSGLGRMSDTFFIQSNDPDREGGAWVPVAGNGSLFDDARLAVPASTSVGRTRVGGTTEASFGALNLGGQPLPVETTVEGDGFFLGKTVPSVLAPGSTNEVIIRYHPTVVGESIGSVIFHQGDPANPLKTVRLSGTGDAAPQIEIDPPALSLGVGDAATTASILVSNNGDESLWLSVLNIQVPYRLVDDLELPLEITPGSAQPIEIGLLPGVSDTKYGDLVIHSNDPAVPVARVPLRAHATDAPLPSASFPAAASGPGLGDTYWSSRAYLLNPTDETLFSDLVFRPENERTIDHPDAGYEIPPRSQRVIPDLVTATGAQGSGGVNLRTSEAGLVAVSRTFASGSAGTYGQFIGGWDHGEALAGDKRYVLAGLAGNDGFHTNVGVLNLGDESLAVDVTLFSSEGEHLGTKRINAVPGGFKQVVSLIDRLTDDVVRGGYATLAATESGASFLAYASVVDDASHDPTLVLPRDVAPAVTALDYAIPAVASLPGSGGTTWRSQLDVVNAAESERSVTIEYYREDGSSIASMAMGLEPGKSLHFDDVVGGLFGEQGKGWLNVTANGSGVVSTSRTYNDDAFGTYGQLIPAFPHIEAVGSSSIVVLAGLSSAEGFRTNIGITSLGLFPAVCRLDLYANDGSPIGMKVIEVPVRGFAQLERVLGGDVNHTGEAWAEVSCSDPSSIFAHASVVDESTGDPTYIPGVIANP